MKRQRGEPFVSTPDNNNYSAAGSRAYAKDKVRFRKGGGDTFSMFVEGFVLDKVADIQPASQSGTIPAGWFALRDKHEKLDKDSFWKTLVADRSAKGNAPVFYQNAIQAALRYANGEFNISDHLTGATELVSEVLRQVQATIWARSLFDTDRLLLGLGPGEARSGDLVCILYGCSVPVILREMTKTSDQVRQEEQDDKDDWDKRQKKAKPLIEQWNNRRSARREEASISNSWRSSKAGRALIWVVQLRRYIRRSTWRIILLVLFVVILSRTINKKLAANMLIVLATPHVYADTVARHITTITSASRWKFAVQKDYDTLFAILPVFLGLWYSFGLRASTEAAAIVGIFEFLYPEVLPTRRRVVIPHPRIKEPTREIPKHYYRLIGECYVHNMMNGEAIEWQNETVSSDTAKKVLPRIFELR